jgi:hypothetical protein
VEVLVAFRLRPIAGVGLVVAAAWIVLVAFECFTRYPFDRGGVYAELNQAVDFAGPGVFGVAALVWLLERAFA